MVQRYKKKTNYYWIIEKTTKMYGMVGLISYNVATPIPLCTSYSYSTKYTYYRKKHKLNDIRHYLLIKYLIISKINTKMNVYLMA